MWADWVFGCFADCDNGYNSLCFRDVQNLTESVCFTESHDQSGQTEICGFQNEIFVLQTKIVASPSVAGKSEHAALIITTFVHDRAGFQKDGSADNELGNGWGWR